MIASLDAARQARADARIAELEATLRQRDIRIGELEADTYHLDMQYRRERDRANELEQLYRRARGLANQVADQLDALTGCPDSPLRGRTVRVVMPEDDCITLPVERHHQPLRDASGLTEGEKRLLRWSALPLALLALVATWVVLGTVTR